MSPIELVRHSPGAPGLRWFGLGPDLRPCRGLLKLQRLLDRHAFWARGRSFTQLRRAKHKTSFFPVELVRV